MKTYQGHIEKLDFNEVFVFGSNLDGFHGGGAAGYASFNIAGNHWRKFDYASKPIGWQGKWNVKGCAEGLQHGTNGISYAIPTVTKAGMKRSRSLQDIKTSIEKFYNFAKNNPQYKFFVAQENKVGLNGYLPIEMANIFKSHSIPDNVYFQEDFAKLLK